MHSTRSWVILIAFVCLGIAAWKVYQRKAASPATQAKRDPSSVSARASQKEKGTQATKACEHPLCQSAQAIIRASLNADVPAGYTNRPGAYITPLRQDLHTLTLRESQAGKYTLRLESTSPQGQLELGDIELSHFIPRISPLAQSHPKLRSIALIQQELNRNQTNHPLNAEGDTLWLANNCLRRGLWEVGLNQSAKTTFHAWFEMPESSYAMLFNRINAVLYTEVKDDLSNYPQLNGIEVPLEALRQIKKEKKRELVNHIQEAPAQLAEQRKKTQLLLSPNLKSYKDIYAAANQPIRTAKFSEPGFYNNADPMQFDLQWLAQPTHAFERRVYNAATDTPLTELEIQFANGHRLLWAIADANSLPERSQPPETINELSQITFGIGTPVIYATAEQREHTKQHPRANYLMLLDASGKHIDNHHAGLDQAYVWRQRHGDELSWHVWIVSYERIFIAAHIEIPTGDTSVAQH